MTRIWRNIIVSGGLSALLLLWSSATFAAAFKVGSASGTCSSPTHATIAAAIAAAAASAATPHTISICPGTYSESALTLNNARHNGMTITSTTANKADVTVAAGSGARAFDINGRSSLTLSHLTITGNNQGVYVQNWTNGVTLDNLSITAGTTAIATSNVQSFTLSNSALVASDDGLGMTGDAGGVTISNVTIAAGAGATDSGIEIANVYTSLSISGVTITSAGYDGIQVTNGNSLVPTFRDLNIVSTRYGIYANNLRLDLGISSLSQNVITAGQRGIWLTGDTGAFQVRDTVIAAGTGSTNYYGILATGAYNVWSVRRVTVTQAGGDAINVTGGSAPVIEDVALTASRDGIVVADGNGPIVQKSAFSRNSIRVGDRGIYFSGSIGSYRIYDTDIWAGTDSTNDHGIHSGNTWADYRIERNVIYQAGGRGMYIEGDSSNGVIASNLIRGAAVEGLRVGRNPAWATATVSGNCFYNTTNIYNNYRSASFFSGSSGNFWGSSPTGSGYSDTCADANSNGICDAAYSVPGAGGANMPRSDDYPLKTCSLVPKIVPNAEYRFDECSAYSNGAGQVVDTQGIYPGTPQGGLQNAAPGKINRYADFSDPRRYVLLPSGSYLTSWSFSVWFQAPFAGSSTHSSQYYVMGSVSGGGDFVALDRSSSGGAYRWGVYTTNASDYSGSGGITWGSFRFSTLAAGWHHMVVVGQGGTTSLYIDGSFRDSVSRQSIGAFRYVGSSYDNAGSASGQSWGTPLDELKIYSAPMSAVDVSSLYANEVAGKNWDGTTRPDPCPSAAVRPFGFNCVESGADALTGHLYTKLAGTAFSVDIVALRDADSNGTADAVETTYASDQDRTVTVELVDGSGSTACASRTALTPAVSQTLTYAKASQATEQGRKALSLTVSKAYANLRCRVTDSSQTPTSVVGCSTDNFSVRPSSLTVTSTNANADSAGSSASATPAIKAGASFALTATSNVAGYNLAPVTDGAKMSAHSTSVRIGALSGSFGPADAATGVATGSGFGYDEVGYFRWAAEGVYDAAFTAVDSANSDCTNDFSNTTVLGKFGCKFGNTSATPYFGRFIPDNFLVTPGVVTPACSSTFTYFGQDGFTTAFTLTARNSANVTTQNYQGSFARLVSTSWNSYVFSTASALPTGSVLSASATAPTGTWSSGQGSITAVHQISRPTAATGETSVSITAKPIDADSVTSASATTVSTFATSLRFGRLLLSNAYGSEMLDLPVPLTAQYYSGTAWVLNAADSCTQVAPSSVMLSGWSDNLSACETYFSPSATQTLAVGRTNLVLRRPAAAGTGNNGSVGLTLNVGAVASGSTCVSATASSATAGNLPQFGTTNPAAKATFGIYKSTPMIDRREVY